jgi:selenocysteine lyase/cysteine desulfurase
MSFHVPHEGYLLNHSVGCRPRAARDRVARFYDAWEQKGGEAWPVWLSLIDEFCVEVAALIGAEPIDVCPQTNLAGAVAKILSALPEKPVVLMSEADFPSVAYAMERGGRSRRVPGDIREHFKGDVQAVLVAHATFGASVLQPVAEIVAAARQKGIVTIVDVAQSAGVRPIDVKAWGADFVVGSCVKWLCGGPGAGFLWMTPERSFSPRDVGWFSHAEPLAMERAFRDAPGAKRFWGGTPSIEPFVNAAAGIAAIRAIGVDAIAAHNTRLTELLLQLAPSPTPSDPALRGGTAVLQFDDADRFLKAGIACDHRAGYGVRFSPHIYNTEADIARVRALV